MSARPRASNRGNSRQRNTNDAAPILGNSLLPVVDDSVSNALHDTLTQAMNDGTRRNYRNRIARVIKYLEENFKDYYQIGVRTLTPEEVGDKTRYHFGHKEDLI